MQLGMSTSEQGLRFHIPGKVKKFSSSLLWMVAEDANSWSETKDFITITAYLSSRLSEIGLMVGEVSGSTG